MCDYLIVMDSMVVLLYIDENKLGVVGVFYGGYLVYYLVGIYNNCFKVFILYCGLFNFESWYGIIEELFFVNYDIGGLYWLLVNKEFYEKNSLYKFVDKWNILMFVIYGGKDFCVLESEGM